MKIETRTHPRVQLFEAGSVSPQSPKAETAMQKRTVKASVKVLAQKTELFTFLPYLDIQFFNVIVSDKMMNFDGCS
jgi:hypothetical protein